MTGKIYSEEVIYTNYNYFNEYYKFFIKNNQYIQTTFALLQLKYVHSLLCKF